MDRAAIVTMMTLIDNGVKPKKKNIKRILDGALAEHRENEELHKYIETIEKENTELRNRLWKYEKAGMRDDD